MLITVDLTDPDNDVQIVGLAPGETVEARLGPRGYAAWRLFGAAARVLFLALQKVDKPDIAAVTRMQLAREARFVRERVDELTQPGGSGERRPGRRPR